jgi:hydroxymethylglutaryl-CoA synthase
MNKSKPLSSRYIRSVGAYLPITRLSRKAASTALRWSGLPGPRDGHRAVAGWDEDALTLALEGARGARSGAVLRELIFASTSAYFTERSQSALLAEALALPSETRTLDVAGSRRCGTTALLRALEGESDILVAAGEKRETQAGSPQNLLYGDGGAACQVGGEGGALFRGGASMSADFVDVYASRDHPTPYGYEERFVRDTAVASILAPTIRAACDKAGIAPSDLAFAAVVEPVAGVYALLARTLGLSAPNLATGLAAQAGDLGAAHPLFAMGLAFAQARIGDLVLVAGFGSGCDALIFEVRGEVAGAAAAAAALGQGVVSTDYVRFLSLAGEVDLAWGMRAETELKGQATVLERIGRDVIGFIGGRDSLGNVQFPKSRIPVNPSIKGPETLIDVRLADLPATIVSATNDRLNYSPDPPFAFGLVQFENGARVMMEFTDRGPAGFSVGDAVSMRFRIKGIDRRRGFRNYFWKAAQSDRPTLEG